MAHSSKSKANDITYLIDFLTEVKRSVVSIYFQNHQLGSGAFAKINSNPAILCVLTDCKVISQDSLEHPITIKYSTDKGRFQKEIFPTHLGNFQSKIFEILQESSTNLAIIQLSNDAIQDFCRNDAHFMRVLEPREGSEVIYFEIIERENNFKMLMSPVKTINKIFQTEFTINSCIDINAKGGVFIDIEDKTLVGLCISFESSLSDNKLTKALNLAKLVERIQIEVESMPSKFDTEEIKSIVTEAPLQPSISSGMIIFGI